MIKRLVVANRGEIATQSDGLPDRIFIHRRVWSQRPQVPPAAWRHDHRVHPLDRRR
jgi:hypothetical protein